MNWYINNNESVHDQLVEQIKIRIVTNYYPINTKLPSVRELANEAKVNPNTMQKALTELINLSLITSKPASGNYVTNNSKLIEKTKNKILETNLDEFLTKMKNLEISDNEILKLLKERMKK